MTAAAGRLGAAQRQMGVAQEFSGRTPVGGENGGANADPDAEVPRAGKQRLVEACADLLGKSADILTDRARRNRDGEFVSAQARDQARCRHRRRQPL